MCSWSFIVVEFQVVLKQELWGSDLRFITAFHFSLCRGDWFFYRWKPEVLLQISPTTPNIVAYGFRQVTTSVSYGFHTSILCVLVELMINMDVLTVIIEILINVKFFSNEERLYDIFCVEMRRSGCFSSHTNKRGESLIVIEECQRKSKILEVNDE